MLKKKQNQNLIPQQLIWGRIKDMILSKVLIMVIISVVLMIGYYYGCSILTEHLESQAEEITKNSAYTKMTELQKEIDSLDEEISSLNKKVKSSSSQLDTMNIEIERNTKIHDITNFIINNKSSNITLIMIEDGNTNTLYSNSTVDRQIQDYKDERIEEEADKSAEDVEVEAEEVIGYDPSMLVNDGSGLSNCLLVRGFAADMGMLSEYAATLGSYESVQGYRIVAVEAVEITDYLIYLFDIEIQF